jgi:hypothetical protein
MEKKEMELSADKQTKAFQHGFMVGFMNGAKVATEAFGVAMEEAVNASIGAHKATDVYLRHSCRSPVCFNFRPGSKNYCSPECETPEQTLGAKASLAPCSIQ